MEKNQYDMEFEQKRLKETLEIARYQLEQAETESERTKEAILEAKKELRENTTHSIGNLWGSEGFEALAELSQYANPVTDKIADYEETAHKIILLQQLLKTPYFARIDFQFAEEEQPEPIYIGRTSLKKDQIYDMYVYDWRSPIASVFYRFVTGPAYYDAPAGRINGAVSLKRQYEIEDGVLEYFFDTDVQIVDEFLRKLLSQNTSPKMKTIVETIQREQDIVIRDMESDLMMVQGVAGSGKTSIALHRAAYLMYQGLSARLSANNIMIISPNTLFEEYISDVLPELGESNVASAVFEEMMKKILKRDRIQSRNQFLEDLITSKSKRHRTIKNSIEWKTSGQFMKILDAFIADIPNRWIAFEDIYYKDTCIVKKEVLKKKILARAEVPLGMKLKQLEALILELAGEAGKGRIQKEEEISLREKIQKFTQLNLSLLYQKLIEEEQYLYSLAGKNVACDKTRDILHYTGKNLASGYLHYEDGIVLSYLHLKIYGNRHYKNIKQVVIDEAQDYYRLQYEIFNLLFPYAKFTILGDMNQTLEKQEDITLYEEIETILNKKKSSLVTMDKSFRCTNEILQFGLQFISGATPHIQSFNREGEQVGMKVAENSQMLADMLVSEINTCMEKGCKSIGIICKTAQNARFLHSLLQHKTEVHLIHHKDTTKLQGVFIIPVYMSKGLEFDAVLLGDCSAENYHSEEDKKLLYIACTRALHRLHLFCEREASPLLRYPLEKAEKTV